MTGRRRLVVAMAALGAMLAGLVAPAAEAHVGQDGETKVGTMMRRGPVATVARQSGEPSSASTPRASCRPGSVPEGEMQGRVSAQDIASGKAKDGYRCNLSVVGRSGSTGGFRVHRYIDKAGHECAYYDTTLLFPTNALSLSLEPSGVAVLDMTDPAKPVRTATLSTIAMQTPHESLNISIERGLLAAVMGNPAAAPGIVDVYDLSMDCRHPELLSSAPASIFGHESGMALDGKTFYPTSIGTGNTTAVDLTNPRLPRAIWQGQYNSHGMSLSDDGTRGYIAASEGLIILDLSEVQARKPNPQVREISRLSWPTMTIPQVAIPVTIKGKPYLVEVDEYSTGEDGGVASNGPRVGAARIIDISDERKPFVVSNIRLDVHQPQNRAKLANDPGARSPVQGYAAHYCNVPQRQEPGIVACSMILSGLRVFDIRDPRNPKEIAYHVAPPSTISATGGPFIDERAAWAMSQPAFAPERGEIWYSDGTNGFFALKMDPAVWPFRAGGAGSGGSGTAPRSCADPKGFVRVGARPVGKRVVLDFVRKEQLPVRVDVIRVANGRNVIRRRVVARFKARARSFTWNGRATRGKRRRLGAGHYVVRFTMRKAGRSFDRRSIVLSRGRDGRFRFRARPLQLRRSVCGLLRSFVLARPVFGGKRRAALRGSYRLASRARVTVVVSRGSRVVKRFRTVERAARRKYRFVLRPKGLRRGEYTVRILAQSGEDQTTAVLPARRL